MTASRRSNLPSAPPPDGGPVLDLAVEQRKIRRNVLFAAVLCAVVLLGACCFLPNFFEAPEALVDRLSFALQADLFVLVWLVVAVQMVSSGRYRSVADNRGSAFGPPSPRIAIKVAFLQNTLEQSVIAVGAHLALASLVTGPSLFFIPAAVVLFAIGRVAFLTGYPHGAGARGFGMATTLIPSMVAYVWAIGLVVRSLFA